MKLVTFDVDGRERIGVVEDGKVIDLTTAYASYLAEVEKVTNPEEEAYRLIPPCMIGLLDNGDVAFDATKKTVGFVKKRDFKVLGSVFPLEKVKLKAPIPRPRKMVCIGLNFEDYRKMLGYPKPEVPLFFLKSPTTVIGPDEPIVIPRGRLPGTSSNCLFQEWELAIVVWKRARHVPKERAIDYIFGFTIFADITAHDIEMIKPGHVLYQQRCKAFDSFSPMGPWIVTKDQISDINNLRMIRKRNNKVEWESTTKFMIWKVPEIIEFLSEIMTLEPGDVIPTASPPAGPEEGLQPGDTIESIIEGIGTLRNPVILEER